MQDFDQIQNRARAGALPPTPLQAEGLRRRAEVYAVWVDGGMLQAEVACELMLDDMAASRADCRALASDLLLPLQMGASAAGRPRAGSGMPGRAPARRSFPARPATQPAQQGAAAPHALFPRG